MNSPVEIVANCPPENMPIERESKKPKLDEIYGEIQGRSSDGTEDDDNSDDDDDDDDDDESDYESDLDGYDGDERLREEYKIMFKQARTSDGFDMDVFPYMTIPFTSPFYIVDESLPVRYPRVQACLAHAINWYNNGVKDDEKIELLKTVKALSTGISVKLFFITFNARVISTNEHKVYQVRVSDDLIRHEIEVELFRPKPGQ